MVNNELIKQNIWKPEDEGDHYPSQKEWWCFETLFKTIDDGKKWNLKCSMDYRYEPVKDCFITYYLFNITDKKLEVEKALNDDFNKLSFKKGKLDIKYENFTITGLYPNYKIVIEDKKQDFKIDLDIKAKIPPHWSAENVTNGYLPIGLGYYRFGWILNSDLNGTLYLKGRNYSVKGIAYCEHAWGNWSYKNPFKDVSNIKKTVSIYGNLVNHWLKQHKPKIPDTIEFNSNNDPVGYDWFWGVSENNISVFFGNAMFWVSRGPSFGVLTVFKDNEFLDFFDVDFQYNKIAFIKKVDLDYPTDITVNGRLDDKKIKLRVWSELKANEYIYEFPNKGYYKAIIMCEMPAKMQGFYEDKENNLEINGDCKFVPQRQPTSIGYNSLKIDFLKPPKGLGLSFDFNSHFFKKRIFSSIQFAPKPRIKFNFRHLNDM